MFSAATDNLMTLKAEESGYSSHNDGSGSNSGSQPPSSPLASPPRSPPSASPVSLEEYQTHLARLHRESFARLTSGYHQTPMVVSAPSSIKDDNAKEDNDSKPRKIWSLAEMSSSSNSNMSEDEHSDNEEVTVN